MIRSLALLAMAWPLFAHAQQGYLPLSRTVDAPWTALMHRPGATGHTAIRPYLREDLPAPATDSTAGTPNWLQRMSDPAKRWHGGPLPYLLAGASLTEEDALKYRAGLGGWLEWNAGPRWTLFAEVTAWHEKLPNYLDRFAYASEVVPSEGYAHRDGGAMLHQDWNAYVDYKAGNYFHFTLGKGRNFIGEGYRSMLLGDEAYGYPYLRITTTAWHLRYVNLFAVMDDMAGAAGNPWRYGTKFASMHYLSWNISRRVNAGFFEAIIWQDNDPRYRRGFDISYVNPVIFLRPVEFGIGSPDNALMGVALSVKAGQRMLLYGQAVLDEFLLGHVRAGDGWYGNKQGIQLGVLAHGPFKLKGLFLRGEMNYARPFMYTHTDNRQNYAHHGQALAHPYGSGFLELLAQGEWRHGPWLVGNTFSWAAMGRDTLGGGNYGNNIFLSDSQRPLGRDGKMRTLGFRLGDPMRVTVVQNEFTAGKLLDPRTGIMLEAAWTLRAEEPAMGPQRLTNYLRLGLSSNLRGRHPFQVVR